MSIPAVTQTIPVVTDAYGVIRRSATEHPRRSEPAELLDSVRHHQVADVPVGVFLSAGADSGVLLGLMSALNAENRELQAVTLAFEEFREKPDDEAPLAAQVARQ